jgi:hypothetical protein
MAAACRRVQSQPSPQHVPCACRPAAVAARRPHVTQGTGYLQRDSWAPTVRVEGHQARVPVQTGYRRWPNRLESPTSMPPCSLSSHPPFHPLPVGFPTSCCEAQPRPPVQRADAVLAWIVQYTASQIVHAAANKLRSIEKNDLFLKQARHGARRRSSFPRACIVVAGPV